MAKAPDLIAYVVRDARHDDDQAQWREVGIIYKHAKGEGFNLLIHDQMAVSGQIVCMPRRERDADRPAQQPRQRRDCGEEPGGRS